MKSMASIQVLSPGLVNRIAAGECVERPASVVKELVENALDAGAARIAVTIHDGGRELVQVVDDGVGMDAEDLRLCVQPHATSKIHNDEDLFNIHTMGFRGEALASIGSVARLQVTARTRESDVAHTIRVDGGRIGAPTPCGASPGTTVEVRDLFYCVPARRKFLRTTQTEMGHITEQFARIALAHPVVAFSLRHQKRVFHDLPATADRRQRLADFYGPELAEVLLPIRRAGNGVLVEGWVAPPKESRGSGKWEYLFVNGRYVRDKFVSHAVKEGYRSLIDPSRYPVVFLFITIDPSQVDVNVHPTKTEIRWRDSNYIHGQVLAALRERFLATNLDHTLETQARDDEGYRERVRRAMVDFFTSAPAAPVLPNDRQTGGGGDQATQRRSAAGDPASRSDVRDSTSEITDSRSEVSEAGPLGAVSAIHAPPFETSARAAPQLPGTAGPGAPAPVIGEAPEPQPPYLTPRAVQIHNTFIVAETDDGLMIVDQHALHERILYEQFQARITERSLESQRLLLPEVVRVPADRIEALETHAEVLQRLGIELTPSGPQSVTLHAFPTLLHKRDARHFVKDLLDVLNEQGARPSPETLLHELLDMMACKAAVKAGDPLTSEEIETLLAQREIAERSSHCPHGRPTTLHLTLRDLERQFKRR
jgi:DNA mismatch repair protein MutL